MIRIKIILINPIVRPQDPPFHIPFGIAILARIADQLGHEVGILDLNANRFSVDAFREELKDADYKDADVFGIGGMSSQYKFIKPLVPIIKQVHPDALLIAGNGFLTTLPEETMKLLPQIGVGVIGEGERTFTELLDVVDNKNFSRVKGLIYREDGEIVRTPYRPLITNLDDEVPWPHWDMLPLEIYFQFSANLMGPASPPELQRSRRRMSLSLERGCHRQCQWCVHLGMSSFDLSRIYGEKIKGPAVRYHSARYAIDMIKHLRFKYGVDFVSILDENFLANKRRCYEFADLFEKEDLAGIVHFGVLGDPPSASDYELLQRLKDVGLTYVSIGIETASNRLLAEYGKRTTIEQGQQAINSIMKAGVTPITTFMCMPPDQLVYGNPSVKPISEFQEGDFYIGRDGQIQNVDKVFSRSYEGRLICIKVEGFPEVKLTPEHPILVRERSPIRQKRIKGRLITIPWRERLGESRWINAGEAKQGHFVIIPKLRTAKTAILNFLPFLKREARSMRTPQKIHLTKDVAELFGWYLAEGCTHNNVHFDLNKKEVVHAERIKELLKKIFNVKSTIYPLRGCIRVTSGGWVLGRFLKHHFGPRANQKRIPEFIMNAPIPIVKAFLEAYRLGDGYKGIWYGHEKEGYTTSSKTLAYQVALLLIKIGKRPCFYKHQRKGIRKIGNWWVRGGDKYIIVVHGNSHKRNYMDENYLYVPIKKVREKQYNGPVYNLKTNDGTFATPFFLVHNCGYPTEKIEDYIKTVEFWKKNQALVRPFIICPYPGTKLYLDHKDRILKQHDGDIEKFLLSLGDATELSANISPFNDAELLGLQQLMTMQDIPRIKSWAREKGLLKGDGHEAQA